MTSALSAYQHAIDIASDLEAEKIVFHANFIAAIHNIAYRQGWHMRNVDFWGKLADYAQMRGVPLAVENMFEFDPTIIVDILVEVDHPYLKACLDVGHAHIFGPEYPFENWLTLFKPWLIHLHMNNTHGKLDTHNALGDGIINYDTILTQIREVELDDTPTMVLEMYEVYQMRESLPYFLLANTEMELD